MLTGKLVRVRYARDRIIPCYIDPQEPGWQQAAERLCTAFRGAGGRTRGELEAELRESFGNDPTQLVYQGLAKLLEDRCRFEIGSAGKSPEHVREEVFLAAARARLQKPSDSRPAPGFDRGAVLEEAAARLGVSAAEAEQSLFADLKSEQRLRHFKDISAQRLLHRYNVALAQAVLLRSTKVRAQVRGEPPARLRQLLRSVKFHRLICEIRSGGPGALSLHLDGPLSLFSATQKYGLQLAMFLPALLLCAGYELEADLRWGPQRRSKRFTLSSSDALVSHLPDVGGYVPPELSMFAELFRRTVVDWEIYDETSVLPLGDHFWVPDFRLVHRASGRGVYLEVLGFWRRGSAEQHLERLRQHVAEPFLLAVSDRLHIDDADLDGLPSGIHRFRQMPVPDEVARSAAELLRLQRS
jgi:predicted nuclease of restriction endonuclease-like RecB superfamily